MQKRLYFGKGHLASFGLSVKHTSMWKKQIHTCDDRYSELGLDFEDGFIGEEPSIAKRYGLGFAARKPIWEIQL